jgi:cell wall-associated NlpC family hydrolase
MAPLSRICLLSLCAGLLAAGSATAANPIVPVAPNPARLGGSVPLVPAAHPRRHASLGARAVAIAVSELGTPYRYGGSSPGGFDCSGLVSYVYGRLGVALPHNAAAQYAYGRPVDQGRLRPGDLVFFHGLGHVGLYVGKGRIIHAPQTGERVEFQSLASRSGAIEGARRLVRA